MRELQTIPTKIVQDGNTVEGDLAGHTLNKQTINIHPPVPTVESRLNRLYRRMAEEAKDPALSEYIGQLKVFTRVVENEVVVGVDAKLELAGRSDEIEMATAMKEMIFAELRQNIFSKSFQIIYATLLGKLFELFNQHVRPLIQSGATKDAIDAVLTEKVIRPVVAELEQCPDCTDAPEVTVRGMIYFLTGNCHLKWHQC